MNEMMFSAAFSQLFGAAAMQTGTSLGTQTGVLADDSKTASDFGSILMAACSASGNDSVLNGGMPAVVYSDTANTSVGNDTDKSSISDMSIIAGGIVCDTGSDDSNISDIVKTSESGGEDNDASDAVSETEDDDPIAGLGKITLPDAVTDDGKNAFLSTLLQYLISSSQSGLAGTLNMNSLLGSSIWDNVEVTEKSAYSTLTGILSGEIDTDDVFMDSASSLWSTLLSSGYDDDEDEYSLKDVFDSLITLPTVSLSSLKKQSSDDETDVSDSIAELMAALGMGTLNINVNVSYDETPKEEIAVSAAASAETEVTDEALEAVINAADEETLKSFCREFSAAAKEVFDTYEPESADNVQLGTDASDVSGVNNAASVPDEPQNDFAAAFADMAMSGRSAEMRIKPDDEAVPDDISVYGALNAQQMQPVPQTELNEAPAKAEDIFTSDDGVYADVDVDDQIMQKLEVSDIMVSEKDGTSEVTMQLSPEELGKLDIRITKRNNEVSVSFAAESGEAAKLIGDKAAALADALASKGMSVKEIVVSEPIRTSESSDVGAETQNGDNRGYNPYEGEAYGNSDFGGQRSKHFIFDQYGSETSEITEVTGVTGESTYFEREARLWTTA
jgi:flagellar hook-length control protein FliK